MGSVAAGGATQWLPIMIGDRRAREMLLFNGRIPARQALDWGLVNRVIPTVTKDGAFLEGATDEQIGLAHAREDGYAIDLSRLDEAVSDLAEKLLSQFPECTRYTRQQVNFWKEMAWHQTIGHAGDWLALHYSSFEPWEGMRAFVQKRPPRYMELRERAARDRSSEFLWGPPASDCPSCGAEGIPEHFAFCGACGQALNGTPAGAGAGDEAGAGAGDEAEAAAVSPGGAP